MVSVAIEDWVWRSHAIIAASLAADGTIHASNPALARLAGRELAGVPLATLIEPSQHPALARRLAAADEHWRPGVFAFLAAAGRPSIDRRLWLARAGDDLLVVGEPVTDEQERLVEKVLELNDELVATHRELVRQRGAAETAAERVRHLEAISAAGLAGLDLDAVLHDVLRVIARAVDAEAAAILLREGDALVVRAALGEWHEGARVAPADATAAEGDPGLVGAADATHAEGGSLRLIGAADATHAEGGPQLLGADPGLAGVPLVLDGTTHGALQVRAHTGSSFTEADLRLLTPAAERAALAISRAQLLERERGIAETLQRALLPERLPEVPGVRLSAFFEPAAGEVGGDWYDAVRRDDGELALAIGDVEGKGIPAATLMGELRGGLRAGVLDGGEPNAALRRLDRLAERAGRMATVLLVLLDPETGALRYASAGHLPPLLIEPGGAVRFLVGGAAPPLLVFDPSVAPGTATLAPGACLLLYTDGLVERRTESIDQSLERLAAAAAGFTGDLPALVAAMVPPEGGLRDDIAVLAVQRTH